MKKYDLAVKVGTKSDGKSRFKNVGVMMEGENGPYILLDKTFNPAGVPGDRDSIIVSMFTPKEQNGQSSKPARAADEFYDDTIPF